MSRSRTSQWRSTRSLGSRRSSGYQGASSYPYGDGGGEGGGGERDDYDYGGEEEEEARGVRFELAKPTV